MELMEKIVNVCKRRGFVFPGSEIYGGLANTWDYGPLGIELKNRVKQLWWKTFVQGRQDVVGLESAILMNPKVWEASGHVAGFNDALVDCKKCKMRLRADHLIEDAENMSTTGMTIEQMGEIIKEKGIKCPHCGSSDFTDARQFNLLFKTAIGVVEDAKNTVYLRGETAQGMFVNFKNVVQTERRKLPFGIAQQGKAFRNEITPGNFIFRTIEFEQMEIEYFIDPESDWKTIFEQWQTDMEAWLKSIGIKKKNFKWREHSAEELSHYSKRTADVEYKFPFGQKELYGLAYRTDFDLNQHQKFSGQDLTYFDQEGNRRFIPHVIEPTFGVERTILALLTEAYTEEEVEGETRIVLKFDKKIAPVQVAILPLSKKEELNVVGMKIWHDLKTDFVCAYDETQSIGKRYRRQDEIGTPYCVTVDFDSLEDKSVTVRDRDTMKQERIKIAELKDYLKAQYV